MKNKSQQKSLVPLIMMIVIFFMPLIAAIYFHNIKDTTQFSYNNKGNFYPEEISLQDFSLLTPENKKFETEHFNGKWWLVYEYPRKCDKLCQEDLYILGQIETALGKDNSRVKSLFILKDSVYTKKHFNNNEGYTLAKYNPNKVIKDKKYSDIINLSNNTNYYVAIADPHGKLIMHFDRSNTRKDILKDLKKLLKNSKIG